MMNGSLALPPGRPRVDALRADTQAKRSRQGTAQTRPFIQLVTGGRSQCSAETCRRPGRRHRWVPAAIAFLSPLPVTFCSQAAPYQLPLGNCAVKSVLAAARLLDRRVDPQAADRLFREHGSSPVSLFEIKKMAADLGIELVGVRAELGELVERQIPAVIHLREPEHFVLLLDGSKDLLRLLESADAQVWVAPRSEIEHRFTGYALTLAEDRANDAAAVRFDETHYEFGIAGVGQQVEHVYGFLNNGTRPLALSVSGST